MARTFSSSAALLLILTAAATLAADPPADAATEGDVERDAVAVLSVVEIAMARDYDPVAKAPVDTAAVFPNHIEKVVCFTRIVGAASPTQITHVWYHEGKTMAKVQLVVGSPNWRTYSSKRLLPAWKGRWEVKVLDVNGALLSAVEFIVR